MKDSKSEVLKNILDKYKYLVKDVDINTINTITEIAKGLEFVEVLKSKAKDVQVKFEKEDNVDIEKNSLTDLLEVFDDKLVINVVLSGLHKNSIFIELENEKLTIKLDTNFINKKFIKYWSNPSDNIVFDLSSYKDRIVEDNVSSTYENGILNISIPLTKIQNTKKKIEIS